MAESAETPKILEELSKSNTAKPGARTSRQRKTALKRVGIATILLLPILAAVLFLGYQQISLQSRLGAMQSKNQQLDQSLVQQSSQLQQLREDQLAMPEPFEVDDTATRELEENVNQQLRQLTEQLAEVQSQQLASVSKPDQEWKILEAEYLLGIASQKLQLEKDLNTAVSLLERADQALLASDSRNVFAVRQAIASELSLLRNVEAFDREGIYLRIDNLLVQMDTIDLLSSLRQKFENSRGEASEVVQISADATGIIDSSLEFLGSIFVWRKWDETPEAMLEPGQDALIKQNLQLMLGQAQLALLMGDKKIYQQSLAKSTAWLRRYAVTDSAAGQMMALELDQLIAIDIDPPMPSISQSLSLISQLAASER